MNIKEYWEVAPRNQKVFITIYILFFSIGTTTHIRDIIIGGILPYRDFALWANIYWTMLTILDPMAILLLVLNVEAGVILSLIIISSDVVINLFFTIYRGGLSNVVNIYMIGQFTAFVFIFCTWKKIRKYYR